MRLGFLLAGVFLVQCAQGQTPTGTGGGGNNATSVSELNRLINGRPPSVLDRNDVDGSPYLFNDYSIGFVKIRGGQVYSSVPVRFEVVSNELQFMQDGKEMVMLDVDSAAYLALAEGGAKISTVLKSGYPAIDGHTTNSLYEILASGPKVHFLKFHRCYITEQKRMGVPDKKEFVKDADYYIYVPATGSIKKVKLSKKEIEEALSGVPEAAKTAEEQKTNFKKEAGVRSLVAAINGK